MTIHALYEYSDRNITRLRGQLTSNTVKAYLIYITMIYYYYHCIYFTTPHHIASHHITSHHITLHTRCCSCYSIRPNTWSKVPKKLPHALGMSGIWFWFWFLSATLLSELFLSVLTDFKSIIFLSLIVAH